MSNSVINREKNRRFLAVVTVISSQFHNVLHKSNCYAKFQCCISYFGEVPCLVPKSGTSASPLFKYVLKVLTKNKVLPLNIMYLYIIQYFYNHQKVKSFFLLQGCIFPPTLLNIFPLFRYKHLFDLILSLPLLEGR